MGRSIYDGSYQRRRRVLVAWGYSNPKRARCWQCKEPLATCGPNRNGRHLNGTPAKWTAGHVRDGIRSSPLKLECSPCNYRRGAERGERLRRQRGRGVQIRRRSGRRAKTALDSVSLTLGTW